MKTAIFGATGMVGSEVLRLCLDNERNAHVLSIGRRLTEIENTKLREIEHGDFLDFFKLEADLSHIDVRFYCLGVYQSQVSKENFWEITVDFQRALVDSFERVNTGVRFILFGAQGASRSEKSLIRFARAKGRAKRTVEGV